MAAELEYAADVVVAEDFLAASVATMMTPSTAQDEVLAAASSGLALLDAT